MDIISCMGVPPCRIAFSLLTLFSVPQRGTGEGGWSGLAGVEGFTSLLLLTVVSGTVGRKAAHSHDCGSGYCIWMDGVWERAKMQFSNGPARPPSPSSLLRRTVSTYNQVLGQLGSGTSLHYINYITNSKAQAK